jgi:hypothetical protein
MGPSTLPLSYTLISYPLSVVVLRTEPWTLCMLSAHQLSIFNTKCTLKRLTQSWEYSSVPELLDLICTWPCILTTSTGGVGGRLRSLLWILPHSKTNFLRKMCSHPQYVFLVLFFWWNGVWTQGIMIKSRWSTTWATPLACMFSLLFYLPVSHLIYSYLCMPTPPCSDHTIYYTHSM